MLDADENEEETVSPLLVRRKSYGSYSMHVTGDEGNDTLSSSTEFMNPFHHTVVAEEGMTLMGKSSGGEKTGGG